VLHTRRGGTVCQRDVYHIFAPEGHGQDGAFLGEKKALPAIAVNNFVGTADAPSLVELPAAILARIYRVNQELDGALASGDFNLVGAIDEVARTSLHPKAIQRRLTERGFDERAEVGGNLHIAGLEGSSQRSLELALRIGLIEFRAGNADPCAAAGGAGANVRCDSAVRAEREPDQRVFGRRTA
jgi:hypothetical protein